MRKSSCDRKVLQVMHEKNWSRARAEKYVYGGMRQKGWKPHK